MIDLVNMVSRKKLFLHRTSILSSKILTMNSMSSLMYVGTVVEKVIKDLAAEVRKVD